MKSIQKKNTWIHRIDRIDYSILPNSPEIRATWKFFAPIVFDEIAAKYENPLKKIRNTKSPDDLYKRLITYQNNDLQLEIFYQRTEIKPKNPVLGRIRVTVLTPNGYMTNTKLMSFLEQALDDYHAHIRYHICYAETCIDTAELSSWLFAMMHCVVPRAQWHHYGYCPKKVTPRIQGFDPLNRNLYILTPKSTHQYCFYQKPKFNVYRIEHRLRRPKLRLLGINNIASLSEKGLNAFKSSLRLVQYDEDQQSPSALIHHENIQTYGKRKAARMLKTKSLDWKNIERPIINMQRSTIDTVAPKKNVITTSVKYTSATSKIQRDIIQKRKKNGYRQYRPETIILCENRLVPAARSP